MTRCIGRRFGVRFPRARRCTQLVSKSGATELQHTDTVNNSVASSESSSPSPQRRATLLVGGALAVAALVDVFCPPANALPGFQKDLTPVRKRRYIDPEQYTDGDDGLKYFDFKVGEGQEAKQGDRVVVHYEAKWKGITFVTSRQGMGVTGGTPFGFDVGATGNGVTLKGLDLGVRGMRVGGVRQMIVPPNLAYGDRGVQEIPPNATLTLEVELLSIKQSPLGYQVKLVEG